jgi:hypothetical protein
VHLFRNVSDLNRLRHAPSLSVLPQAAQNDRLPHHPSPSCSAAGRPDIRRCTARCRWRPRCTASH